MNEGTGQHPRRRSAELQELAKRLAARLMERGLSPAEIRRVGVNLICVTNPNPEKHPRTTRKEVER